MTAAFSRGYWLYGYEDKTIEQSSTRRKEVPHKQTYDAECAYAVNQLIRFDIFEYLQRQRDFVTRLERGVPVVHLAGHKLLVCKILLALFYHWCNGHFTGEGAEQAWPFMNRVATYSSQAGPGHRHDIHIAHYNDHNRKKLMNLSYLTARELVIALAQLEDNMLVFRQMSAVHHKSVAEWSRQDLVPRENPRVPGSWTDAYHRPEKEHAPSVTAVLESIAQQEGGGISLSIPKIGIDLEVYWTSAFKAKDLRERITILSGKSHLTETEGHELNSLHTRLDQVLEQFRQRRCIITPRLPERFSAASSESFVLGLPSAMTADERTAYDFVQLAEQEASLRKSHAYDTVNALHSTCQKLEALVAYKKQNVTTDAMRTRMGKSIDGVIDICTRQLAIYNHNRHMLLELKAIDEDDLQLPPLSIADTGRKDINHKRRIGDSKRREGALWRVGPTSLTKVPQLKLGLGEVEDLHLESATRLTRRELRHSRSVWDGLRQATQKAKAKAAKDPVAALAGPSTAKETRDAKRDHQFNKDGNDGVLWTLGSRRGLDVKDTAAVAAFERGGNRISWTRQQAQVYRWMEEFERKHAELHRIICYFRRMESCWKTIAANPEDPANHVKSLERDPDARSANVEALRARALRQAAVWGDMALVAVSQFREVCYPPFFDMETPLAPRVEVFRNQQFEWAKELGIERADLKYGATKAGTERSKPVTAMTAKLRARMKATATVKAKAKATAKVRATVKSRSKETGKGKARA
ncbi:hypothetical protein PQX77_021265 [Marasmius sp. AFHP31]|nr:hypothetical protein PQX77_021265 [Marasmius sp. AFHP31]